MSERGTPSNVRVGPGKIYFGEVGTTPEPTDLATPLDNGWVLMGYTDTGSTWTFNQTFENVEVAEELDPVAVLQTAREINLEFAAAEVTAANMQRALNGGTITVPTGGVVKFEPPGVGEFAHVAIVWEAEDGLERWIFRKCLQVGSMAIARQRAPNKATLPMTFRAVKPDSAATFTVLHAEDYAAGDEHS